MKKLICSLFPRLKMCDKKGIHTAPVTSVPTGFTMDVLKALNTYRASNGLLTLEYVPKISDVCYSHCLDMISANKASHAFFTYRYEKLKEYYGYKIVVGEIISVGYKEIKGSMDAWIASAGHKSQMDGKNYRFCGIGESNDSKGKRYITVIFLGV